MKHPIRMNGPKIIINTIIFFYETLNESRPLAGERDLKEWKAKAILMTHEIKQRGMIARRYELCRVAKEDYGLTLPGCLDSNSHCTDIDDILCVVTNPDWYYDDINIILMTYRRIHSSRLNNLIILSFTSL